MSWNDLILVSSSSELNKLRNSTHTRCTTFVWGTALRCWTSLHIRTTGWIGDLYTSGQKFDLQKLCELQPNINKDPNAQSTNNTWPCNIPLNEADTKRVFSRLSHNNVILYCFHHWSARCCNLHMPCSPGASQNTWWSRQEERVHLSFPWIFSSTTETNSPLLPLTPT